MMAEDDNQDLGLEQGFDEEPQMQMPMQMPSTGNGKTRKITITLEVPVDVTSTTMSEPGDNRMELANSMRNIANQNQDQGIDLNLDMGNFDEAEQGQTEQGQPEEK